MPKMPDPASRCPLFARLSTFTHDHQDVCDALKIWTPWCDFIHVGVAYDVIDIHKDWKISCPSKPTKTVNEREYLEKYWFDGPQGWWKGTPGIQGWRNKLDNGLHSAFMKSCAKGSSTHPYPVEGLWICMGNKLEVKGPVVVEGPPFDRVVILALTPAPPAGCEAEPA